MFAGPNGSGKTTILTIIGDSFDLGHYINADNLEASLNKKSLVYFKDFGIRLDRAPALRKQLESHPLRAKSTQEGLQINLEVESDCTRLASSSTNSYEAALIADLFRNELLRYGKKFAFETVMSHPSKITFLKAAERKGYKNYLYFISTESPLINIERVDQRVRLGGHAVTKEKIADRYSKTMDLLLDAARHTYRTFLFLITREKPPLSF